MILHVKPEAQMGDLGISEVVFESRKPGYQDWDFRLELIDDLEKARREGGRWRCSLGPEG